MIQLTITLMSKTIAILALSLAFSAAASSAECDKPAVVSELQSMLQRDQQDRASLVPPNSHVGPADATRLADIVDACGWPGVSDFGERAALGAFLVLQHADLPLQLQLVPLLRSAATKGQLVPGTLPLLEDRIRVRQGLPQLYGSQFRGAGQPYPIEDPDNLDARRKAVGLAPYSEYMKQINRK